MQQVHEFVDKSPYTLVFSVGGSALHPDEHFNVPFIKNLKDFTLGLTKEGKIVILIVGGGSVARLAQHDTEELGVAHAPTRDQIGVYITVLNAMVLERVFAANGLHTHTLHSGDFLDAGIVYIRGGSVPGHTTDYVAVGHAIEAGQNIVFNISTVPGLHPIVDGQLIKNEIIADITWQKYIDNFSVDHAPGVNTPFDKEAALLAQANGLSVILLGSDISNIQDCLSGKPFQGTVIHP